MPDTCPICNRYYANYNEGHTPNSKECLKNQLKDVKAQLATSERQRKELEGKVSNLAVFVFRFCSKDYGASKNLITMAMDYLGKNNLIPSPLRFTETPTDTL